MNPAAFVRLLLRNRNDRAGDPAVLENEKYAPEPDLTEMFDTTNPDPVIGEG